MSGSVSRLRTRFLNRYRQCYYHFNLFRYNASKDWNEWYRLPGLDKICSLRSNGWREKAFYIRDLARPRIHGSVKSEDTIQSEGSAAKVPFMITKQMKLNLLDLGYTIKDINGLTPLEAHQILSDGVSVTRSLSEEEIEKESTSNPGDVISLTETLSDNPRDQELPPHSQEDLRKHLLNVYRIQSGLGSVRLKVNSTLVSIDRANSAISAALEAIQK